MVRNNITTEFYGWGKALANKRILRGMSIGYFAELLNVTIRTVYRWESEENIPDVFTAFRICEVLECSIEDVFYF